ncbi:MAG: OB-fold domain-containing protein [Candidatus Roizmanbacteria bacterium]|nr:OB-fold domain-containing protein [Candidatus Roizmanbacteria bacterium]
MISPVKVWRRQKTIRDLLGKTGVILSWTKIFTPPPQFKHIAPYTIVYAKLENGQNICAQLVDFLDNSILIDNKRVVVTLRKLRESVADDVIPYTIACKLI